ncbi:MAG: type IV pilus modification PilV family protein [Deltaproteobacteria bacterium]
MINKNLGFTLSELMVSAAILSFVFAALLLFFINSIFLNEANRKLTIATTHAQYALEEMKNTNFSSLASTTWYASTISGKGLTPLPNESIMITVTGTEPKDIVATVRWAYRGTYPSIALETLITEP